MKMKKGYKSNMKSGKSMGYSMKGYGGKALEPGYKTSGGTQAFGGRVKQASKSKMPYHPK